MKALSLALFLALTSSIAFGYARELTPQEQAARDRAETAQRERQGAFLEDNLRQVQARVLGSLDAATLGHQGYTLARAEHRLLETNSVRFTVTFTTGDGLTCQADFATPLTCPIGTYLCDNPPFVSRCVDREATPRDLQPDGELTTPAPRR